MDLAFKKTKPLKEKIIISLFLTIVFCAVQTAFFPVLRFVHFAPFMTLCCFNFSFVLSLWSAVFIGLFVDLTTSLPVGLYALTYTLTTLILYSQKRVFNEKALSFLFFSSFFSVIFTLIYSFVLFILNNATIINGKWLLQDVIIMSFADGLYALIWIYFPLKAYELAKNFVIKLIWKNQ